VKTPFFYTYNYGILENTWQKVLNGGEYAYFVPAFKKAGAAPAALQTIATHRQPILNSRSPTRFYPHYSLKPYTLYP